MAERECPREDEVLEALQTSAWPDCCQADLRTHVESCQACADLVAVVLPLLDEHRVAVHAARLPTSATVWWRMQLRARREAAAVAMRPISVLQGLALACGAGLLVAAVGLVSPAVRQFGAWMIGVGGIVAGDGVAAPAWASIGWLSPLGIAAVLAAMLLFVVTPVAVYLTVRDK